MTTIRIYEFDNQGNKVHKNVKYIKGTTILIKWDGRREATIEGEFKNNKFYPTVIQKGQPDELKSNGTFFFNTKKDENDVILGFYKPRYAKNDQNLMTIWDSEEIFPADAAQVSYGVDRESKHPDGLDMPWWAGGKRKRRRKKRTKKKSRKKKRKTKKRRKRKK